MIKIQNVLQICNYIIQKNRIFLYLENEVKNLNNIIKIIIIINNNDRGDKIDVLEAASVLKRSKTVKRLEDWEEKVLHGQYLRQTKEVRSDHCWAWRFFM